MPYAISRFKVEDYDEFKRLFLSEDSMAFRRTHGSRGGRLFRSTSDPKEIIVLGEWDDLEKSRQFYQSNELRERQQRAGVVVPVEIYEEIEHF